MRVNSLSIIEATTPRRLTHIAVFLLVLSCCVALNAQNIINTVAGGGSVAGPANGPQADIPGPSSVIVDSQGNMYVASPAAEQIYKVDPTGAMISVFAGLGWVREYPQRYDGSPATQGSFNGPTGLAIDGVGNIYVADTNAYLIWQINPSGIINAAVGNGHLCHPPKCGDGGEALGATFSYPTAVATDSAGNIYIADTGDNRIRAVNTQSAAIVIAGVTINPGKIQTVAGNGTPCSSSTSSCGDGGKAVAAELNSPNGVTVDHLGNIFIADSGDRRIRVVTPKGYIATYAGTGNACNPGVGCGDGGPAKSANLSAPWQIYVDPSDNLYISDPPENRIRLVNSSQVISSIVGTGSSCNKTSSPFCGDGGAATSALLNAPRGVYADANGNVYVGDTGDQRVRKVTASTQDISTYTGGGNGGDGGPATSAILADSRDIAVDNTGNYYIADTANNRIRKVSGGTITTVAGNGLTGYSGNNVSATATNVTFNQPWGIALDGSGDIFVADTGNKVIRKISAAGVITLVAGTPGQVCSPTQSCGDGGPALAATFAEPTKVAVDNVGNLYIADLAANRIRKVDTSGNISTIAGNGGVACTNPLYPACGDGGPATSSQLSAPYGVAVDSNLQVYIADTGDNRVRKIDTSGNINGYAFTGEITFGPNGVAALDSSYNTPLYVTLDSRDNLFVSGSDFYYVIQRVDASTVPIVNPVASVAGVPSDPKYYGYCSQGNGSTCDGDPAVGSYIDNFGAAVDSSENLYIADGGNNRVRMVSMVPVVNVQPPTLTFPDTPIGQQSQPLNFTATNNGSDDLTISGASTTGPFALQNATPCPGNIVAPHTTCTYSVIFTPTGYGPESGTAVVNDNSYNSPSQTVTLNGSGPDFSLTASPNTLTIAPGNAGYSTLTLTPKGGFNQTVNLTCTGVPAGTTCVANPNQVTLDGTDSVNSTLTVTVGNSTAPGTYTLRAKGTSVLTRTVTITLTVP
ncbi:MAG TPA: choice-of-anchor D domain-containing protein [Terriglobales bacterium]|nr:choice-of-anchor D domain-containing protein [Terriglobales bacterium]